MAFVERQDDKEYDKNKIKWKKRWVIPVFFVTLHKIVRKNDETYQKLLHYRPH